MNRLALLLTLVLLVAGCAAPKELKSPSATYTNPVYVGTKDKLPESADPGPIKYNGEYWAYVTANGCQALHSTDLVTWTRVGSMLTENVSCWAPDVTYKNGTFYAYLSTRRHDEGEQMRRVRLYTSDKPQGPFTYVADVTDKYSYDGHYFRDIDGDEYFYWTQECATLPVEPCAGNGTVVDRLIDMKKLAGQLTRVAAPEIGSRECGGRCILEAPYVRRHGGLYFMQYSAGAFETDTYFAGYFRNTAPMGKGGATDESWVKGNVLVETNLGKVDGPGHSAWITGPNNIDDWTIYHGRGVTRETWDRWLRIDPVMWGRDRFWTPGGASYEPQPGPAMPHFRDLFDAPNKEWKLEGPWSVADGALRTSGTGTALVGEPADHYVLEANLRFTGAGGRAGVYAYYPDAKNALRVELDQAKRVLTIVDQAVKLPADFKFDVYHQLLILKNADRFTVFLDGVTMGAYRDVLSKPGRTGLFAEEAAVEFDGFAVTHGWDDFFTTGPGWGHWPVQDGTLVAPPGKSEVFKGPKDWGSYEFTASMQGETGRFGMYAAYADPKNYLQVLLEPATGSVITRSAIKGKVTEHAVAVTKLPASEFHTLRVIKNGFEVAIYLNGEKVYQLHLPIAQSGVGLVAEDAAARFDAIRAVRWD